MDIANAVHEKVKAGYPSLYLLSAEDARSMGEIKKGLRDLNNSNVGKPGSVERKLFVWTLGKGIIETPLEDKPPAPATAARRGAATGPQYIADTEMPAGVLASLEDERLDSRGISGRQGEIYVLRHFHHFLEDPSVQAAILHLIPKFKAQKRSLLIVTPVLKFPPELEKELALIESELPDEVMLGKALDGIVRNLPSEARPLEDTKKHIIDASKGLTTTEAENAFSLAIVRTGIQHATAPAGTPRKYWDPAVVMEEKVQTLKKSGLLTYFPPGQGGLGRVGGMANLKQWVQKRARAFTPEAKAFGLAPPKGLLLVGPPGTGKSAGAKAISEELHLPLLRCDIGAIFGSLVGQSEANARKVIQTAEAIAPCVLWLDELEKAFAGMGGGGSNDSGTGARVFGTFLTWMQEKQTPVFVYATANNVRALPPELLRKGRFDETFSVMLPTKTERVEIFQIHLKKKGREKLFNRLELDVLATNSQGFTGAEIEVAISDALFAAFSEGKELTVTHIVSALDATTPLSVMMKADIDAMVDWCKTRTRPANAEETQNQQVVVSGRAVEA